MEAIVLTEEQAAALRAANGGSPLTLEPRRLSDGRLILNADVLSDPFFADRSRGWAAVLLAPEEIGEPEETGGGELSPEIDVDVGVGEVGAPAVVDLAVGVQRVVISEGELAQ